MSEQLHVQVSLWDGDEWVGLGDYLHYLSVELGDVSNVGSGDSGADAVVSSLQIEFLNEGFVEGEDWSSYPASEDLFQPNNPIIVETVFTDVGVSPPEDSEEWDKIFEGFIGDSINIDGKVVELSVRDKAGRLQDYFVPDIQIFPLQEEWSYKPYYIEPTDIEVDGETYPMYPAHLVIEQIIEFYKDEGELIWNEPDLATPDIPEDPAEWHLSDPEEENYIPAIAHIEDDAWGIEYQSIWDAIQAVAQPFGWYVGMQPDGNEYRLTFMEPPRDKEETDHSLTWTEDIRVQNRETSYLDVRNEVTVVYGEPPEEDDQERARVTVRDEDSIDRYGYRGMMVEEGDTWFINNTTDAHMFANAMLDDLSEMSATHQVDLFYNPEIKLFDLIEFYNPLIESSNFEIAVESVKHELRFGDNVSFQTSIVGTQRVVGGHRKWLSLDAREGIKSPIDETEVVQNRPMTEPKNLDVEGDAGLIMIEFSKPATRRWSTTEFYISESTPVTPTPENLKATARTSEIEFRKGMERGVDYYVAVRHVDTAGNRSELVEYPIAINLAVDVPIPPTPYWVDYTFRNTLQLEFTVDYPASLVTLNQWFDEDENKTLRNVFNDDETMTIEESLANKALELSTSELPIAGYEIRTDTNFGVNDSNLFYRGNSTFIERENPDFTSETFYVKSFNSQGQYSEGYDTLYVEQQHPPETNFKETKCKFEGTVQLFWDSVSFYSLEGYEIRTDTNFGEDDDDLIYRGNSLKHVIEEPDTRDYTFYIKTYSTTGYYSLDYNTIELNKEPPSQPNVPNVTEFFQRIWVEIFPVNEPGIEGYYVYITPSDGEGNETGDTIRVPMATAGRYIHNAEPNSSFLIQVSAYDVFEKLDVDIDGEGEKSEEIERSTVALVEYDIPDELIEPSKLSEELSESINEKIKTFRQDTEPLEEDSSDGDLWIDTSLDEDNEPKNTLYYYDDGTWEQAKDRDITVATEEITQIVTDHYEDGTAKVTLLADEYTVKLDDNTGAVAGFGLALEDDSSEFAILADRFKIYNDYTEEAIPAFVVSDDQVIIPGDLFVASITSEDISTEELIVNSANIADAIIDDSHINNLSTSKLTVGGARAKLGNPKPYEATLLPFDRSVVSTDGQEPDVKDNAKIEKNIGHFGNAVIADTLEYEIELEDYTMMAYMGTVTLREMFDDDPNKTLREVFE